jgi:cystathionine beta-lyase/cystathionine gamma-synthase
MGLMCMGSISDSPDTLPSLHCHIHQVTDVFYPGLESHDGHDVAKRQMPGGFGGMVSFVVEGGASAALKVHTYSQAEDRWTSSPFIW